MKRRKARFITAVVAALSPLHIANGDTLSGRSSPLCLVPVQNGEPTKADIYQSFRMTWEVVNVLGLDRPIIFPLNRGGVWTIDAAGAFVPFGGEFPNQIFDQYASDPSTGIVIGVNWKLGVFRLRPGEGRFERLHPADGKPFTHPFSAAFVERFGGIVVSDNSGLYLLRRSGVIEKLHWDASVGGKPPGMIFDLPELGLMLFQKEGSIYARDDSGKLTLFDKGNVSLSAARVTADGQIFLKMSGKNLIVPWPPPDPMQLPVQQGVRAMESYEGIEVNNRTIVKVRGKRMSVRLPADVHGWPIGFPGETLVAEAGRNGLYALNDENSWDLVDQSREISGNLTKLFQLPVERQALLVNVKKGLFLLVKKTDPRATRCLR